MSDVEREVGFSNVISHSYKSEPLHLDGHSNHNTMTTETQQTQIPFESREGSPGSSVAADTTKVDAELADRLSHLIEGTVDSERLEPMLKLIRHVCVFVVPSAQLLAPISAHRQSQQNSTR